MPTKVHLVKAMVFPVVTYRCESWTIKKAECQRTDAFKLWCWRRLLRVPWNKPVNPKGNQTWIFIGKTDAEAPILWPPDAKSWHVRKDLDAGKDWGQEEKGTTEDKMVVWHHWLNGHEFEQAPGDGEGQGSLVYSSPWCCRFRHNWVTDQQVKENLRPISLMNIRMKMLNKYRQIKSNNLHKNNFTLWPCGIYSRMYVLSHSVMSDSWWPPWTVACQVPLSTGILQARILEWDAMPSSRGSS